jgi:hypothetical protein
VFPWVPARSNQGSTTTQPAIAHTMSSPKPPQTFGGGGGSTFDTGANLSGVRAVTVRHGWWVDAIQLHFNDGTHTSSKGGDGGEEETWVVPAGQRIVQVDIWAGRFVDAVQFTTSDRTKSPKYGGSGGTKHTCAVVDPRNGLVGLLGASGWYVDALACRFDKC